MQPKIRKKSGRRSSFLILLLVALCVAMPEAAYAWTPNPPADPISVCEGEAGYEGFTRRIVLCITNTVLSATYELLGPLFAFFYTALGAAMTLAVVVWGIMMMTGHSAWSVRRGSALAIKIAVLVMLFTGTSYNFLYFYSAALDMMSEVLGAVTGYVNFSPSLDCGINASTEPAMVVWDHIDCAINTLIGGVYNDGTPGSDLTSNVATGIGGFLLAAFLSGGVGIFVAMLGFMVVVQILFAVIRALYIYILAYVAFSLMALVAPLFLPLILFKSTQGYFEKWLKLTIGFILQPIFLFVYLAMLLAAYDVVVYSGRNSVFNVITHGEYLGGCAAPTTCPTTGCTIESCTPIGTWLRDATGVPSSGSGDGPPVYREEKRGNLSVNYDPANAIGRESCSPTTPGPFGPPGPPTCSPGADLQRKETGLENKQAEMQTSSANWREANANAAVNGLQAALYRNLNIDDYFFHVDVPTVNWDALSSLGGGNLARYFRKLLTSLFMAVVTTYIFLLLLEKLPFIGSGIMNIGSFISGSAGMPGFGFGALAPPGAGMVNNLKKKVM